MSNLLDLLRRRRGLFGSAAVPIVVVGACAFPDYTFETQTQGSGGSLGGLTTGDMGALTGSGGIPLTTGTVTGGGAMGSSSTSTTGVPNSGGSAGSDFGGAAGETADGGSSAVGGTTTDGGGGSVGGSTGIGGWGGSGGSGGSGTGGSAGNGPCGNHVQCASRQCDDGMCRLEHCGNGEPDVNETDTDCGGADCRPCGYEKHCVNDTDCATGDCSEADTCRPKLVISCFCNSIAACDLTPPETMVDLRFRNTGTAPIDLTALRFHYYYSAEGAGTDAASCVSVNFNGGTCELFNKAVRATEYVDESAGDEVVFSFTSGTLAPGATTGPIQFVIENNGPYDRSNDYSFQNVPTNMMEAICDRIVATNAQDVPVWGLLPE